MGIGDPAWAARHGGVVPRSRHTQPPSPGPSVARVGPRTYVAPYITNQHYGTVHHRFSLASHGVCGVPCTKTPANHDTWIRCSRPDHENQCTRGTSNT